jgi:hypothetical protein
VTFGTAVSIERVKKEPTLIGETGISAMHLDAAGSGDHGLADIRADIRHAEPLGYRSRRLFRQSKFPSTRRDPGYPLAHIPPGSFFVGIIRLLTWWSQTSVPVKRTAGVSRLRQFIDIAKLTWGERLYGQSYYLFELYRPDQMARRGEYQTRWETKNGLLRLLTRELVDPALPRSNVQDKLVFAENLEKNGLSTVPIIASFDKGTSTPAEIDPVSLRQDLFTKLRFSKGAEGAGFIRYLGHDRYSYDDHDLNRDQLLQQLKAKSQQATLIILPRLVNHPAIAGLSGESLMAVRIFSMLNEQGEPELVFAMLRILGKLEPAWHSKVEWAVEVDLETGELGLLTGDILEACTQYTTHHPITGAAVQGVVLPYWAEARDAALRAHRVLTMDRLVIGWDIAITPTGPSILEGNVAPDVAFPQHVGRRPFGQSRYGEIFHHYLDRLEEKWAARNKFPSRAP